MNVLASTAHRQKRGPKVDHGREVLVFVILQTVNGTPRL